jgi:dTDP-4-dehydrorhamnose 3,5-epimerase
MSRRFDIHPTPIAGVMRIERLPMGDDRGTLERMFCRQELAPFLGDAEVIQANLTRTVSCGTVRGMHYQAPPFAEDKIVTCLRGQVWDVAVDLREGSPTFLRWHGERLDGAGHRSLIIPRGFAHGFQTLSDDCVMLYFHSAAYEPTAERGLDAMDPRLAIEWPIAIRERSARDRSHPPIRPDFRGVNA